MYIYVCVYIYIYMCLYIYIRSKRYSKFGLLMYMSGFFFAF